MTNSQELNTTHTTIGNSIRGRVHFTTTATRPLTPKDLEQEQIRLGYHPLGYGIFDINIKECLNAANMFEAYWQCSASCD